ncbi:MAG TPA: HD domain-containing protein [Cyclobacteriaceae bacterium]|nr:CCA tRNA nucleotidyltransferase [Cyclobacteriaceae bacterium]HMV09652.1 HD domain-containing protein [Cyclobacteriaceae bacterium]HMV89529.1 HD domain-containing protein [Cyclobacteriaceae bacterium]HMX01016.1 HD domain-containing protein [Cyclobacteriaceae bacterium]HMX52030.1 HD domain-containing protein [Cyclobacteriaceae bacterium]
MNLASSLNHSIFKIVGRVADDAGVQAFVVGGYVRDLLLKRESKDIDFVCVGSGIELAEKVAEALGPKVKVNVFKNFGTAQISMADLDIEFVGARRESYRTESRKPIVEDGTLDDDQKRRDFTINAMAICVNEKQFGELVDPFNGQADLKSKLIKTPLDPAITFSDDPLRMMRAIRFASQLNFDIDADTFQAISEQKDRIKIVSQERITDELNKIISSKVPSYGFKLLFQSGLLKEFFPEMVLLQGVEYVGGNAHKDNFYHTLQVLDNVAKVSDDLWLRWSAILHDIAKPQTKRYDKVHGFTFHGHEDKGARMVPGIFRRLKLPMNDRMEFVQKLVRMHLRPIPLSKEVTDSAIRRLLFEAGDDIDALMKLCRADITSKNNDKVNRFLKNFDLVEQKMAEVEAKDHIRNFQPPVSGDEIIAMFNIPPGRVIGEIKERIKEAILEGEIRNDREEALQLLNKIAKEKGLA